MLESMSAPRILIVEDELIVALELDDRLGRQGYTIVGIARTAEEALAQVDASPVELALLDGHLAGARDGIELAGDLRARGVPVVFLTAHGDEDTLRRIKAVEPQGYLLKPFDERLLHLTIETALHRHAAERGRLAAERARRAAQTLQASILEHSPDGVLVVDADGNIELANRAAQKIFGLASDSFPLLPTLLPKLDCAQLLSDPAVRAPRRVQGRHLSGKQFPVEVTHGLAPLEDAGRLILIVRDVSVQTRLEKKLARARQLEVAGRVASGVAHDLNNLLSMIWMSTFMMHDASPSELAELLAELENAVTLGAALTTRLLSTARESGAEPKTFVLNEALQAIGGLLRHAIGEAVHFTLELDPRAGSVCMDPPQLDQLVLNLVLNADRAMPQGGQLTLRTVALCHERELDMVAIEIEDTGVGMSKSVQRRVFEPFFSVRSDAGGTGLGLSIAKDVVEGAGGLLELESELGQGTLFRVMLPRHDDDDPPDRPKPAPQPRSLTGQGRVVLLVDDDDAHRRTVARLLETRGFKVVHARGAGEAMLVAERGPDPLAVAIVELELPYMDGLELSKRLKQLCEPHQPHQGLPVIAVTGAATLIDAEQPLADALLRKPLLPQVLFDALAQLLPAQERAS